MNIGIGIPISRKFDWRTCLALLYAMADAAGAGHQVEFIVEGNHERPAEIVAARNSIAERAYAHGADYLLWLDSDATAAPGMLRRLLNRELPIVSALCFKRKYPVTPACGRKTDDPTLGPMDYPPPIDEVAAWVQSHGDMVNEDGALLLPDADGGLLDVDVVGTHYTLIRRDVLTSLPRPWYKRTTEEGVGATGSDWYFCKQAKAAGYPVYVDMTAVSGHLEGSHCISVRDFAAWTVAIRYSDYLDQRKERHNGTDN